MVGETANELQIRDPGFEVEAGYFNETRSELVYAPEQVHSIHTVSAAAQYVGTSK
jgi:hypothetical protein